MRNFFEGFILSLGFFTQINIPYYVKNITNKTYKYLALTIPLAGIILATITILIFLTLSIYSNEIYAAIVASVLYLFLYGFLHLEAVADIIDAHYASHGGKDAHEILKDSHVGAVGAIATFCIVILKVSAMSYLLINGEFLGILATLYLSRLMIVGTIYKSDFHNQSKFIYSMKNQLDKRTMTILTLISLIIITILDHILLIPIALIGAIILKNWLLKKIGFLNGDGLGFMIEINELILLNIVILS